MKTAITGLRAKFVYVKTVEGQKTCTYYTNNMIESPNSLDYIAL